MEEGEGEEMRKGRSKEERQKNRGKKNKRRESIYITSLRVSLAGKMKNINFDLSPTWNCLKIVLFSM